MAKIRARNNPDLIWDAVKIKNNEYADHPYTFEETPAWLRQAIIDGVVVAQFKGEDYWYMRVDTPSGWETMGPDDYIVQTHDGIYGIYADSLALDNGPYELMKYYPSRRK